MWPWSSSSSSGHGGWNWIFGAPEDPVLYGPIQVVAQISGASEAALRLLVSLLLVYPIAIVYRLTFFHFWTWLNHLFIASAGIGLIYFNYGTDVVHSLIAVIVTYVLMHALKRYPNVLVVVNFIFHMTYLLVAYYYTETNDYDIIWTMPHCVLVLRLIGIAFNLADGSAPMGTLSKEQLKAALTSVPSLLELTAYTYFPGACLVGPQFPFRRYEKFIKKEFPHTGFTRIGLKCLTTGLVYLLVRQLGTLLLPDKTFFQRGFDEWPLWLKWGFISFWGKISLYKYVSCWLLAEGACTCFGISYVGQNEGEPADWSACSNIKLGIFERASRLEHYVQSFNVNTNHWVAEYVYKRLKFLNNRTISYASALIFLALWHGFHSGYYMSFFLEYMIITFEKQMSLIFADVTYKCPRLVRAPIVRLIIAILRMIYTLVLMGLCLVPFVFLRFDKWWTIYKSYSFAPFLLLGSWFLGHFIYKRCFYRRRRLPGDVVDRLLVVPGSGEPDTDTPGPSRILRRANELRNRNEKLIRERRTSRSVEK